MTTDTNTRTKDAAPDQVLPLWPGGSADDAEAPTLSVYLARQNVGGATVLVCPGGGYWKLGIQGARNAARWLVDRGVHAAILRYRLGPKHKHPAMTQDAQRAMRLLRADREGWGVDPEAIAAMGFSAGGHLASTLAVHHDNFHCAEDDLAGEVSARPDVVALGYAVIDMAGPFTHQRSRSNFIGSKLPPDLLDLMSTDRHVTAETPPAFLWHTAADEAVPMENCFRFAEACRRNKVPVEVHVYERGSHGTGGMNDPMIGVATWRDHCLRFLWRHLQLREKSGVTCPAIAQQTGG